MGDHLVDITTSPHKLVIQPLGDVGDTPLLVDLCKEAEGLFGPVWPGIYDDEFPKAPPVPREDTAAPHKLPQLHAFAEQFVSLLTAFFKAQMPTCRSRIAILGIGILPLPFAAWVSMRRMSLALPKRRSWLMTM